MPRGFPTAFFLSSQDALCFRFRNTTRRVCRHLDGLASIRKLFSNCIVYTASSAMVAGGRWSAAILRDNPFSDLHSHIQQQQL